MSCCYYRLRLEIAKNDTLNKKKTRQLESVRYDDMQRATSKSHEQLRDELIDNKIKNDTRETKKIMRMRARLERNEQIQDSQKLLLQHLAETDKAVEQLATAAQNGDIMKCRELIRAGVNVNEPDSSGFLPLHYACMAGRVDVATLLLEHGSDVSSYLTGMSPMEISAKNGHVALLTLLFKFGGDVDDGGAGGSPPIVSACSGSHLNCVECLAELGAEINAGDLEGLTALHMASKLKAPKPIIKFLLSKGADKTRISRALLTPLQLALSVLNVGAIEALGGKTDPSESNTGANSSNNNANKGAKLIDTIAEVRAANNRATAAPIARVFAPSESSKISAESMDGIESSVFSAMTIDGPNHA